MAFSHRLQEVRAGLAARMQVSPPQYRIVMALARAETPEMTATALAASLDVSTAFIVTEAQKLGDMGLVKRRRNPDDARSFLIALSPQGRQKVYDAAPITQAVNDILFEDVNRAVMFQLVGTTQSLLEASVAALDLLQQESQVQQRPVRRVSRAAQQR